MYCQSDELIKVEPTLLCFVQTENGMAGLKIVIAKWGKNAETPTTILIQS